MAMAELNSCKVFELHGHSSPFWALKHCNAFPHAVLRGFCWCVHHITGVDLITGPDLPRICFSITYSIMLSTTRGHSGCFGFTFWGKFYSEWLEHRPSVKSNDVQFFSPPSSTQGPKTTLLLMVHPRASWHWWHGKITTFVRMSVGRSFIKLF